MTLRGLVGLMVLVGDAGAERNKDVDFLEKVGRGGIAGGSRCCELERVMGEAVADEVRGVSTPSVVSEEDEEETDDTKPLMLRSNAAWPRLRFSFRARLTALSRQSDS